MNEPAIFSHIDIEVARTGLFEKGDRIMAGISGGPDSLLLLLWLVSRCSSWGWELHVAHFDHRLRPDSGEDAEFVAALCEEMGVPCAVGSADVARLADQGGTGVEEAARRARFAFLAREAMEHGCSKIALAHTADDQVETVLMHLLRGSGLSGLVGMRPLAPFPPDLAPEGGNLWLVRPLLTIWKREVEQALKALGYSPRRDPTNADPSFLRNRVRMTLIPQLEFVAPGFRSNLVRTARLLAEDEDYISGAVEGLWEMIARWGSHWAALELKSLRAAHPSLRKRLVRKAFEGSGPAVGSQLEEQHVAIVLDLLRGGEGTTVIDLPGGVVGAVDGRYLVLAARSALALAFSKLYELPIMEAEQVELVVPGVTRLSEEWELSASLTEALPIPLKGNRMVAYVDFDLIEHPIVRTRRVGDRFQPLGMSVTKKLQDFLVDEKVPGPLRDRLPLVAVGEDILWVCGVRVSEAFRVTEATMRVLRLEVRRVT